MLEHSHFERERLFACLYSLLTTTTTTTRSFKRPTFTVRLFLLHFFIFLSSKRDRPFKIRHSWNTHPHTETRFSLESAREKEDPFFYRRLLDVGVARDDEHSRLFLLKLFSRSRSR